MEGGKGSSLRAMTLMVMMLMLGVFAGQCKASPCYRQCFVDCELRDPLNILLCGYNCIVKCFLPHPHPPPATPSPNPSTTSFDGGVGSVVDGNVHYYCNLGCATHSCAHFSTQQNPDMKEVKACFYNCTDKCNNKN